MRLGRLLAPAAFETLAPVILKVKPLSEITMTPREAQAREYGFDIPSEAHPDIREAAPRRVFGREQPSDEGLDTSLEEHIGAMDARDAVRIISRPDEIGRVDRERERADDDAFARRGELCDDVDQRRVPAARAGACRSRPVREGDPRPTMSRPTITTSGEQRD